MLVFLLEHFFIQPSFYSSFIQIKKKQAVHLLRVLAEVDRKSGNDVGDRVHHDFRVSKHRLRHRGKQQVLQLGVRDQLQQRAQALNG